MHLNRSARARAIHALVDDFLLYTRALPREEVAGIAGVSLGTINRWELTGACTVVQRSNDACDPTSNIAWGPDSPGCLQPKRQVRRGEQGLAPGGEFYGFAGAALA